MDPLIGSALIGGASSLLGGLFGSKDRDRDRDYRDLMNRQQMAFAREQFDYQKSFADRARKDQLAFIQNRVADARKAGIHPLFALGAPSSSVGPGGTVGMSLDTGPIGGAGVGEGIARAGQVAADALGRRVPKALANAQLRQIQSVTEANEAQGMYYRAQAAKTASEVNPTGVGRGSGVTTFPLGPSTAIQRSPIGTPLKVDPDLSAPGTIEARLPSGKAVRTLNPEVFEELWHILMAVPELVGEGYKIGKQHVRRWTGRPTYRRREVQRGGGYYKVR